MRLPYVNRGRRELLQGVLGATFLLGLDVFRVPNAQAAANKESSVLGTYSVRNLLVVMSAGTDAEKEVVASLMPDPLIPGGRSLAILAGTYEHLGDASVPALGVYTEIAVIVTAKLPIGASNAQRPWDLPMRWWPLRLVDNEQVAAGRRALGFSAEVANTSFKASEKSVEISASLGGNELLSAKFSMGVELAPRRPFNSNHGARLKPPDGSKDQLLNYPITNIKQTLKRSMKLENLQISGGHPVLDKIEDARKRGLFANISPGEYREHTLTMNAGEVIYNYQND